MKNAKKIIKSKETEIGILQKILNQFIDFFKNFSIINISKHILQAVLFILTPIFTTEKNGKRKFNPVYFYIFISVSFFFASVTLTLYMIWQIAFSVVNHPQIVATACGGLVTTLIIVIDRMMAAYNKGKEGK